MQVLLVNVNGNIDSYKLFERERLLNKCMVKQDYGHLLEYLVQLKGYDSK